MTGLGSVSSSVVIEPSVMGSSGSEELSSCPIQPERGTSKNSATIEIAIVFIVITR